RTGVEWQEGVLIHVLREGVACSRMSFHKARLVLEHCFDELIHQIVREIGPSDGEIIYPDGGIVLLQAAVGPSRNLRSAELGHRFTDGFHLLGRKTDECDRLFSLHLLDRRRRRSEHRQVSVVTAGKQIVGYELLWSITDFA